MAQLKMTEELKKQFDSRVLDMDKIVDTGAQFTDRKRISMIKSRIDISRIRTAVKLTQSTWTLAINHKAEHAVGPKWALVTHK